MKSQIGKCSYSHINSRATLHYTIHYGYIHAWIRTSPDILKYCILWMCYNNHDIWNYGLIHMCIKYSNYIDEVSIWHTVYAVIWVQTYSTPIYTDFDLTWHVKDSAENNARLSPSSVSKLINSVLSFIVAMNAVRRFWEAVKSSLVSHSNISLSIYISW